MCKENYVSDVKLIMSYQVTFGAVSGSEATRYIVKYSFKCELGRKNVLTGRVDVYK